MPEISSMQGLSRGSSRSRSEATFGGPIKKEKTFFHAVYEGLRSNLGLTTVDIVPDASVATVRRVQ